MSLSRLLLLLFFISISHYYSAKSQDADTNHGDGNAAVPPSPCTNCTICQYPCHPQAPPPPSGYEPYAAPPPPANCPPAAPVICCVGGGGGGQYYAPPPPFYYPYNNYSGAAALELPALIKISSRASTWLLLFSCSIIIFCT
ncbi:hypothetical protein Salat_0249700 [Sesamum alatum]|uniref:Uncharacterized protein n=1 Tax=Sesamum alatum TaxID=300844 RepID=A0AAE1Z067_9LAMI|nr:hypothetical protein Salat_0249700 [Sesamum alatum]